MTRVVTLFSLPPRSPGRPRPRQAGLGSKLPRTARRWRWRRLRPKWRPFSKLASIKWQNDSHADVRRRREMNFHAEGGSTAASWPHVWSGGARRDRHEGIKRDPTLSLSQCAVAVFLCPSALLHSPSISLPAPIHQSPLTESVARPHKISRRLANTISRRSGRGRQCSGRRRKFSLLPALLPSRSLFL